MVEKALRSAPPTITLWDRNGRPSMPLEAGRVFFGGSSDNPEIVDPYSLERRPFTRSDVRAATIVCDALPNVDFTMTGGLVSDVDPRMADRISFAEMVLYTTKPLMFCCKDRVSLDDIIKVASVVAGGEDALSERPFICHYSEPVSPLVHGSEALDKLKRCAEFGLPCIYIPMPMAGASAPATAAGTLVVNIAECLSGLVLSQLWREGAPFIFGGIPGILDMKTAIFPYAAPEMWLWSAALADVSRFYGLPMFSTGGCSDSKTVDQQAAAELMASCLMGALSGAQIVHDLGFLDHGDLLSLEFTVLADEVIGMVRHIVAGVCIDDREMALDVIGRVGPGGRFIGDRHTRENYKRFWLPSFFDRSGRLGRPGAQESESRDMFRALNERVRQILATHTPAPVPVDVVTAIRSLEETWK